MLDFDADIVYLMRVYKWEYEYTVNLLKHLPLLKLNALMAETRLQEEQALYDQAQLFALVCATMVNMESKHRYTIQDFIGQRPGKIKPRKEIIVELVKTQLKLKIPKE